MKLSGNKNIWRSTVISEAVTLLSEKPVKTTTLERIRIMDEFDELVKNDPQPLRYGRHLKNLLSKVSTPIQPYDLLLGRVTEKVPDDTEEAYLQQVFHKYSKLPGEPDSRPTCFYDGGHSSCYWKDVVQYGISGLKKRAISERSRRGAEGDAEEQLIFLDGAIMVYESLQIFLHRYADAADAAGLFEAAAACRGAADHAPETFREALQMLWAIQFVYCSYLAPNPTLTYGRLDQFLFPLYAKDLAEGRLTREEAGLLILDYYSKNNLNMGRGEHQLGIADETLTTGWQRCLNFDAPQYLILGGCDEKGEPATNDLSLLFAQQIQPRFKNPVIVVHYTKGMHTQFPDFWKSIASSMRNSASLMVYNDIAILPALLRAGVDFEDAVQYEHYGCNWPCLPGIDTHNHNSIEHWSSRTPKTELTENDRRYHAVLGRSGPEYPGLPGEIMYVLSRFPYGEEPDSIDVLYDLLKEHHREKLRARMEHDYWLWDRYNMEPTGALQFKDCFYKYSIPQARSFCCGANKYFTIIESQHGFATAADILTAIDELIYRSRKLTFPELRRALAANFEGYSEIRSLCLQVPKLGSDSWLSNYHGRRLLEQRTDTISEVQKEYEEKGYPRIIIYPCMETDTSHIRIGKALGATPDGRLAGVPVSQNSQPSEGASVNGLTSRLRAMAQLPFDRVVSGAQNLSIQPRIFEGEKGVELLAAAAASYFEMGGLQLQVSAVDVEDLTDAQIHPEKHRDLMVRITGYSAVFVDMTKQSQDDLIRRERMGL